MYYINKEVNCHLYTLFSKIQGFQLKKKPCPWTITVLFLFSRYLQGTCLLLLHRQSFVVPYIFFHFMKQCNLFAVQSSFALISFKQIVNLPITFDDSPDLSFKNRFLNESKHCSTHWLKRWTGVVNFSTRNKRWDALSSTLHATPTISWKFISTTLRFVVTTFCLSIAISSATVPSLHSLYKTFFNSVLLVRSYIHITSCCEISKNIACTHAYVQNVV